MPNKKGLTQLNLVEVQKMKEVFRAIENRHMLWEKQWFEELELREFLIDRCALRHTAAAALVRGRGQPGKQLYSTLRRTGWRPVVPAAAARGRGAVWGSRSLVRDMRKHVENWQKNPEEVMRFLRLDSIATD